MGNCQLINEKKQLRGAANDVIGTGLQQLLLIGLPRLGLAMQVGRCHRQAQPGLLRSLLPGLDHGLHIGNGVAEIEHWGFRGWA